MRQQSRRRSRSEKAGTVTERLPPITIHPPGAPGARRPHRVAGKRYESLAEAEAKAHRLARRAGCYRLLWSWPGETPVMLAEVYPRTVARTEAGEERARQERRA